VSTMRWVSLRSAHPTVLGFSNHHEEPGAAKPPPKQQSLFHHRGTARLSRNQIRISLPQRRKVAKEEHCHFERREKSFLDPSYSLGMTGLGPVTWRLGALAGAISESQSFRLPENLRKLRKSSTIVVQSSQSSEYFLIKTLYSAPSCPVEYRAAIPQGKPPR